MSEIKAEQGTAAEQGTEAEQGTDAEQGTEAEHDTEGDYEETEGKAVTKDKSGIVYLSRVPPFMKPNKMRNIMAGYGDVGRIFLQPEDDLTRKRRKMTGGSGEPGIR